MFTLQLDGLFSIWNNAIHCMNFWGTYSDTYRTTAILSRDHTAFFNNHYFSKMTNMPDEMVLARIMTVLDLEFERALKYHIESYDSDNVHDLPSPFMRPVCIYLVSVTGAPLNPMDYKRAQGPHLSIHTRGPRYELLFCQTVC